MKFKHLFLVFLLSFTAQAKAAEEAKGTAEKKGLFSMDMVKQAVKEAIDQVMPISNDYNVILSPSPLKVEKQAETDELLVKNLEFEAGTYHFHGFVTTKLSEEEKPLLQIRGNIQLIVDVPIVSRIIYPDEEIAAADISWQKMPLAKVNQDIVQSKDELVGKVVKGSSLKPGMIIRKSSLKAPVLIRKKDTVKVIYVDEGLTLTTLGEAQQDGAKGDFIRITLLNSKKDLQAQVKAKGHTELQVIG